MNFTQPRHVPLRLAVILLLAGCAFSQGIAQMRYSVNVVGYSDADSVAGSNLVANPFDAGNNTVSNLFAGVPSESFFVPWDPVSRTLGQANRFTTPSGWTDGAATLRRPDGGFLWLPAPKRITFVGESWPPMCVTFPTGESVTGVLPQYACGFCGIDECFMSPPDFTVVRKWDRQTQQFVSCQYTSDFGWDPSPLTLAPDEAAFFISAVPFTAKSPGYYGPQPVQLFRPSRSGTNLIFQFQSSDAVSFFVQRTPSIGSGPWRTAFAHTAAPVSGIITVTVPTEPNDTAFYRVDSLRLFNPSRTGQVFSFQFNTEDGARYQIGRSVPNSGCPWSPMLSIKGTGGLVTVTDYAATDRTAMYRVEY